MVHGSGRHVATGVVRAGFSPARRTLLLAVVAPLLVCAGCASTPPPAEKPVEQRPSANAPLPIPARRAAPSLEAESYGLGVRDVLTVRIFSLERAREVSTFDVEVDVNGTVSVPFAGTLAVAGKTVDQVRALVVKGLAADFLVNPQVTVVVKEFRSRPIRVVGAVEKGGVFYLQKNRATLVEALALAGGLNLRAGTRALVSSPVQDASGGAVETEVDLVALLLAGDDRLDLAIGPHASVNVLPAEDFYVVGYVPRPGSFPYHRPITVTQAVGLAGGVDERVGSPSAVVIVRPTKQGAESHEVDLTAIAEGDKPDVPVLPGDTVQVRRTFGKALQSFFETVLGRFGFGLGYQF